MNAIQRNSLPAMMGDRQNVMGALTKGGLRLDRLTGATRFVPGAIIIDWFDPEIFDDIYRRYIAWNFIDKRVAPGETTGGFEQTAIGSARAADRRSLGFSATNPTRSARNRKDIKAIVKDISFGIFDLSVGSLRTQPWGDLLAKDVADEKNAAMRFWSLKFYEGRITSDPLEFDGLRELLDPGTTIDEGDSIIDAINTEIVDMINDSDHLVMPTHILCNAKVQFMIGQELLALGVNVVPQMTLIVGGAPYTFDALRTPAGNIPLVVDPFNRGVAGTPNVYPTFIVSADKLSYQYVPVLGSEGPEPKTFEIAMTNTLDREYKTAMFGAMEMLEGTRHHKRLNVEERTVVVPPASTS